jgi:hypothetical protein
MCEMLALGIRFLYPTHTVSLQSTERECLVRKAQKDATGIAFISNPAVLTISSHNGTVGIHLYIRRLLIYGANYCWSKRFMSKWNPLYKNWQRSGALL